ncbi:MAG TPA: type III-A CRISPR-associated RAMP protein Csm5, partial [Thermoplasmataceae archaeon]|nr:type III-A CRISPR-associated RAMP protein Csm5 [Thermoplasmataceae archaeon]
EDGSKWLELFDAFMKEKGRERGDGSRDDAYNRLFQFLLRQKEVGSLSFFSNEFAINSKDFWRNGPVIPTVHYVDSQGTMTPLIPGSSVKGALRRALVFSLLRENVKLSGARDVDTNGAAVDKFLDSIEMRRNSLESSDSVLLALKLFRSQLDDAMRFLQVSDFMPGNEFGLAILQSEGKVTSRRVKTNYLAITSGRFYGDINLSRSFPTVLESYKGLRKSKLLEYLCGMHTDVLSAGSFDQIEKVIVENLIGLADSYARENGKSDYALDRSSRHVILGTGKGAPLTTVIRSNPRIVQYVMQKGFRVRARGGINSIREPKTKAYFSVDSGKVRPGLCRIEVMK